MKNKIDYEILNKRVEYLIDKLGSLEDFVNFLLGGFCEFRPGRLPEEIKQGGSHALYE